jgi:hypothetical protein
MPAKRFVSEKTSHTIAELGGVGFAGRETLEFLFQNFYRPRGNDGGLAPLRIELHLLEEKRL